MTNEIQTAPYSDGLAAAYVSGGELAFSRKMAQWILRKPCRGRVGRVLDVACGAGEAVRVFREAGWQAMGLDKSESMLAIARTRNGDGASFHCGTMQDLSSVGSGFDLVTCMYDAINCNLRATDLMETLRRMFGLLSPGGLLVFDAFSVGGLARAYQGLELHTHNRDHVVLTTSRFDSQRAIGTKELLGASRNPAWTPWREVHRVRAYPPRDLLARLERTGFEAMRLHAWPGGRIVTADQADELDRFVVVAQRPGEARE